MRLASRMDRLGTETAFEVLARAKLLEAEGVDVVHLEIGEPDFDTPGNIIEAAKVALDQGYTHYGPSPGLAEVRIRIAQEVSSTRGIPISSDQVVITPGGKPIMFFSILALVEEGDEVIYPNPGFPIYESMINFAGATPVPIQLHESTGFNIDLDELKARITPRTRLMIINSPNNPTGSLMDKAEVEAVANLAVENDLVVLSDEIYRRFLYQGEQFSIASLPAMPERTIILDGFSKTYAMTGWRIGYGVLPRELVEPISRLVTNSVSCTASFIQRAVLSAMDGPQDDVLDMIGQFRMRRDIIVEGLNSISGIRCVNPKGAFYVFPNIEGTGLTSQEFADSLLREAGVALLSGTAFGKYGEGFVRLSFANSVENIQKALDRIQHFLSKK